MKADLRAGKTGAKGIVKKYAAGGMTTPMGGKIAPPGIAAMAPSSPALAPRPMVGAPAPGNQLAPANMPPRAPLTGGPMAPQMPMGGGIPPVRTMTPMAPGSQIMPTGRAYAKGGMVGCGWTAPSSKTMRGAARKGK
jgi:hypothetical protein